MFLGGYVLLDRVSLMIEVAVYESLRSLIPLSCPVNMRNSRPNLLYS